MRLLALSVFIAIGGAPAVLAESSTSTSSHYQVTQTQFGSSSASQTCSASYCARASIGEPSTGDSASTQYKASFGPITDSDPLLEVIVNPGVSNLGDLSSDSTATKTTVIKIRTYLTSGYTLQITGAAPKYGNHSLTALTTPTASSPGTEQFGFNLAANTTPSVGASPVQVPSSSTSFGVVNDDYKTPNLFKYVNGDSVAHSDSSSGETDYTVSMIVNISSLTPAGHYSGDFSAVVIPVY